MRQIRNFSEKNHTKAYQNKENYNNYKMSSETQTSSILNNLIIPFCKSISEQSIQSLTLLIEQTRSCMSVRQFESHLDQWKVLAKKLNTNDKLLYLKQENCRILIIELIKQDAMKIFNSSYLNRAKIDNEYIKYLKQLKPYFFIEVIMIVSKLKTIHKHFYKRMCSRTTQDNVSIKILRILELCNEKKRSVNNNKAKFLCIVEDEADRLEITKQLGKMLREAWKKEKSGQNLPCGQEEYEEMQVEQQTPAKEVKESVKQSFTMLSNEEFKFQLDDQMFNFEEPSYRIRSTYSLDFFTEEI